MDAEQILQDCFDPTNHALRVTYGDPDLPCSGKLDAPQIIKYLYVPALHALRVADPAEGSGTYGSKLSLDQIIKKSFSATTGELRIVGVVEESEGAGFFADRYFAPRYFPDRFFA